MTRLMVFLAALLFAENFPENWCAANGRPQGSPIFRPNLSYHETMVLSESHQFLRRQGVLPVDNFQRQIRRRGPVQLVHDLVGASLGWRWRSVIPHISQLADDYYGRFGERLPQIHRILDFVAVTEADPERAFGGLLLGVASHPDVVAMQRKFRQRRLLIAGTAAAGLSMAFGSVFFSNALRTDGAFDHFIIETEAAQEMMDTYGERFPRISGNKVHLIGNLDREHNFVGDARALKLKMIEGTSEFRDPVWRYNDTAVIDSYADAGNNVMWTDLVNQIRGPALHPFARALRECVGSSCDADPEVRELVLARIDSVLRPHDYSDDGGGHLWAYSRLRSSSGLSPVSASWRPENAILRQIVRHFPNLPHMRKVAIKEDIVNPFHDPSSALYRRALKMAQSDVPRYVETVRHEIMEKRRIEQETARQTEHYRRQLREFILGTNPVVPRGSVFATYHHAKHVGNVCINDAACVEQLLAQQFPAWGIHFLQVKPTYDEIREADFSFGRSMRIALQRELSAKCVVEPIARELGLTTRFVQPTALGVGLGDSLLDRYDLPWIDAWPTVTVRREIDDDGAWTEVECLSLRTDDPLLNLQIVGATREGCFSYRDAIPLMSYAQQFRAWAEAPRLGVTEVEPTTWLTQREFNALKASISQSP